MLATYLQTHVAVAAELNFYIIVPALNAVEAFRNIFLYALFLS